MSAGAHLLGGPLKLDLRVERLEAGHSIRSLGRALGMSQETIARAEQGEPVSPQTAKRIADFFERRVSDIWDLEAAA